MKTRKELEAELERFQARCVEYERTRAERKPQFGELEHFYGTAPIGLALNDRELRYVRINERLAAIHGLPVAAHLGRTPGEVLPEIGAQIEAFIRRVLATEEPVLDIEIHGVTPAEPGVERDRLASYYPVEAADGTITGVGVLVLDIPERNRTEAAMLESESKFRAIIEVSPVPYALNDEHKNITYLNPAFVETFGYDLEDIPTLADWWPRAYPDAEYRRWVATTWQARLDQAKQAGTPFEPLELHIRCRDGTPRTVMASAVPLGATFKGVHLVILYDITERKLADQEKERLAAQLLRTQKMQAVGQLAGGVAHDFNNFLTVILGNSERLLARIRRGADESTTEEVKGGLREISFAAERAAALTRQLLSFDRKESTSAQLLDLGRVVRDQEEILRRLIREDIMFDIEVAPDTRCVRADATEIEQVLMNLVLNAQDSMPEGGTLTLACANVDLDATYAATHVGAKPGRNAMLTVSDTGVGMNEETLDHLFEPFFTTKSIGKGTGLGLATVYAIVQRTSAHISVESEPGRGSTFRVYFPAVEGEAATPAAAARVEPAGGEEVIMVCEDDELLRRGVCRDLRAAGYTVFEAENGKRALTETAGYDGKMDLLISDVIMPEMNGKQLAEAMVARYPGIRVLFVSGYTDNLVECESCQAEGRDFLPKPFAPIDLLRRVRDLLDEL